MGEEILTQVKGIIAQHQVSSNDLDNQTARKMGFDGGIEISRDETRDAPNFVICWSETELLFYCGNFISVHYDSQVQKNRQKYIEEILDYLRGYVDYGVFKKERNILAMHFSVVCIKSASGKERCVTPKQYSLRDQ